jgi:hypothetical protein
MPRGDGTGPMGMGAMTGRGMGFCAGYVVPGDINPQGAYGMGCLGMGGAGFSPDVPKRAWPAWAGYGFIPAGYAGTGEPPVDEREALRNRPFFWKSGSARFATGQGTR